MAKVIGTGLGALKEFARRCLSAGGIPLVRTRYGGRRLPESSVVVACWGKGREVPGGTIKGVPMDVIERLERETGDYRWLVEGY